MHDHQKAIIRAAVAIAILLSLIFCVSCTRKAVTKRPGGTYKPDAPPPKPPKMSTFEETFGGKGRDAALAGQRTSDGGYIMLGWTNSFGAGGSDMYLVKGITDGDNIYEAWSKTFGGAGDDWGRGVVQTSDGGYILVGETNSLGARMNDVYLVRTDAKGNELWSKMYGGADNDKGNDVIETEDGGFAVFGWTKSQGAGDSDFYLIKTDADGDEIWRKTYGGKRADYGRAVAQTPYGGYIMIGSTKSFGFHEMIYVVKVDESGGEEWSNTFGLRYGSKGRSLVVTSDGGYVFLGDSEEKMYIVKTDSDGNKIWEQAYKGLGMAYGYSVKQTPDGGYVMAGSTKPGRGPGDFYIVRAVLDGNELYKVWERMYGGEESDIGWAVDPAPDGGYAVIGWTNSYGFGDGDMYIIKTDDEGLVSGATGNP